MIHEYIGTHNNVFLRPLCLEDIECLRIWRNCEENTKYLKQIEYITPEMQRGWFERYLKNSDEMVFAIVRNDEDDKIVGSLALYAFKDGQVEFGKFLIGDPDAHGKRIGFNAVIAALEIVFGKLKFSRAVLKVYEENISAYKIYTDVGFKSDIKYLGDDGKIEIKMSISKEQFYSMKK